MGPFTNGADTCTLNSIHGANAHCALRGDLFSRNHFMESRFLQKQRKTKD